MSTAASKAFHTVFPPRATGKQLVQSIATAAAAADTPLWTGLGIDRPSGKVYLMVESRTTDVFIKFKAADTAADCTANNGILVKADQPAMSFWVDSQIDNFVDFIAPGGAGFLKWYVSSPEFDGQNV